MLVSCHRDCPFQENGYCIWEPPSPLLPKTPSRAFAGKKQRQSTEKAAAALFLNGLKSLPYIFNAKQLQIRRHRSKLTQAVPRQHTF